MDDITLREATRPRAQGAAASAAGHPGEVDPELLELAASRLRILEAATAERRRIERELHDGVQQQMVAIRIKLALALEAIEAEPERGQRLLRDLGWELDGAIDELRSVAHGIYPALLASYGLAEALRAAGRSAAGPVAVEARTSGRYPSEIESAVYFCCLQALQELGDEGAGERRAVLRLDEQRGCLRFELSAAARARGAAPWRGRSLLEMRDRIAAVGGTLLLGPCEGAAIALRGSVPVSGEQRAPVP